MIHLRRAGPDDAAAVAEVLLGSFHATYAFPLAHPDDDVRAWVRAHLIPETETWVAVDADSVGEVERVLGFASVTAGWLEQLYVDPDHLGEGIGRRLLDHVKELQPDGLLLWTFQANDRARRFYERNGFTVARFGDESNNEERQPDVQYRWTPGPDS